MRICQKFRSSRIIKQSSKILTFRSISLVTSLFNIIAKVLLGWLWRFLH